MPRIVVPDSGDLPDGPDISGFREAQDRLRQATGSDVIFRIPNPKVYADSVAIDPETHEPYDPTTVPISGGDYVEVTIRVSPVFRPIRPHVGDSAQGSAMGSMRNDEVALLVGETDYPSVEHATHFIWNGITYFISETTPDGLKRTDHYIFFGAPR